MYRGARGNRKYGTYKQPLGSLHVRPAVLKTKLVPGVFVAGVAGFTAILLLGQWVVVVIHDQAEVLVVDDATMEMVS